MDVHNNYRIAVIRNLPMLAEGLSRLINGHTRYSQLIPGRCRSMGSSLQVDSLCSTFKPICADVRRKGTDILKVSNWCSTKPTAQMFFCTGQQDLVRCYSCGLGMKDWTAGDDCLLEHVRYSPRCSHLEATVDTYELQDYRNRLQHRNGLIINGQAPRNPHFASRQTRLESFQTWTNNVDQTPEELAEAGFFYTGQDDVTRCYFCDGGLQHGDEGDEPWVEHARWFPHCEYVRRIKGQQYIDTVQAAVQPLEQEEEMGFTDVLKCATGTL